MNLKTHIIIIGFFVLAQQSLCGQEKQELGNLELTASLHYGIILPHRPIVTHLVNQHIQGVEISLERKTRVDLFSVYNKSSFGQSMYVFNLRNDFLGYQIGYFPYLKIKLIQRFAIRLGVGTSFSTKTFDRNNNHENLLVSSKLNGVIHAQVQGSLPMGKDKTQFSYGLSFTHSSNGAFKLPNYGINLLSVSAGLNFNGGAVKVNENKVVFNPFDSTYNRYRGEFGLGLKESFPSGGKKYMTYSVSFSKEKLLKKWIGLTYGLDGFYNRALLNEQIKENLGTGAPDVKQVAGVVGAEVWMGRLVATVQYGFYLYQPYVFEGKTYSKIGVRYQTSSPMNYGIRLKSHGGKADFIELYLHRKF